MQTLTAFAREHLVAVGMYGATVCPWRLAHLSGLTVGWVDDVPCTTDASCVVWLPRVLSCRRVRGGVLACGIARALLQANRVQADDAATVRVGRELLLPLPIVMDELRHLGGDLEKLARHHLDVPHAWIADAADDLERGVGIDVQGVQLMPVASLRPRVLARTGSLH